jgi:hypothetical protein
MAYTQNVTVIGAMLEGPMIALGLTTAGTNTGVDDVIQKNHVLGSLMSGGIAGWLAGIRRAKSNPNVAWHGF